MNDNCVVDTTKQVLRCNTCGDEVPIPLGDINWVCNVIKAFGRAHPSGGHSGSRTLLSGMPRKEGGGQ